MFAKNVGTKRSYFQNSASIQSKESSPKFVARGLHLTITLSGFLFHKSVLEGRDALPGYAAPVQPTPVPSAALRIEKTSNLEVIISCTFSSPEKKQYNA